MYTGACVCVCAVRCEAVMRWREMGIIYYAHTRSHSREATNRARESLRNQKSNANGKKKNTVIVAAVIVQYASRVNNNNNSSSNTARETRPSFRVINICFLPRERYTRRGHHVQMHTRA